jgi:hypothetical protein
MSTPVMERTSLRTLARPWGEAEVTEDSQSALDLLSPLDGTDDTEPRQAERVEDTDDARRVFEELADELSDATRALSSTRLALGHPAYAEIMAMGERCIPWLIERLETVGDRPIWLRLLGSLTRFQPGAGQETVPEAAAAWIRWNRQRQPV